MFCVFLFRVSRDHSIVLLFKSCVCRAEKIPCKALICTFHITHSCPSLFSHLVLFPLLHSSSFESHRLHQTHHRGSTSHHVVIFILLQIAVRSSGPHKWQSPHTWLKHTQVRTSWVLRLTSTQPTLLILRHPSWKFVSLVRNNPSCT